MLQNRFPPANAARNTNLTVACILLFVLFAAASHAVTWRDSFEDGRLNGWQQPENEIIGEIVGYEVLWTTGNDRLNVQVLDLPPPDVKFAFFSLHLVVEGVHCPESFAGIESFPPLQSFSLSQTAEIAYVLSTPFEHLKVVFSAGRFQVYSADKLMATMIDLEYETVDLVGLMIWGEVPGSGSLDEFVISGSYIPNGTGNVINQPTDKLVTTWACIKGRSRSF